MGNVFFIGDTHFGHTNIIKFEPVNRPFLTIEEHDEELIRRWNSVVTEKDIVWHLGDFVFKMQESHAAAICRRLNGDKRLILGNHDNFKKIDYTKFFTSVYGCHHFKRDAILSHIPVHEQQLNRWPINIHGHLHSHNLEDKRYWNVSCEQINLTPIAYEELKMKHR
jgi:calcineurin-like phosphoesterase family protein